MADKEKKVDENIKTFEEQNSIIHSLNARLKELESTTKTMADVQKRFSDALNSRLRELDSTTKTMEDAQKRFSDRLNLTNKKVIDAGNSVKEQRLANDRLARSLGLYANTIPGVIKTVQANIVLAQKESALSKAAYLQAVQALGLQKNLTAEKTRELEGIKKTIQQHEQAEKIIAQNEESLQYLQSRMDADNKHKAIVEELITQLEEEKNSIKANIDATNARKNVIQSLTSELQQQISTATAENIASGQNIDRLTTLNDQHTANISELDKALTQIRTKYKNGQKMTQQDLSLITAFEQRKAEDIALRSANKAAIKAEIESRRLNASIIDLAGKELQALTTEQGQLEDKNKVLASRLDDTNQALDEANLEWFDVSEGLKSMADEATQLANETQKLKNTAILSDSELKKLKNKARDAHKALEESTEEEKKLQKAVEDRRKEMETKAQEELNTKIEGFVKVITAINNTLTPVANLINNLVKSIRDMQQQFGLSAGSAAKLKFENMVTSIKSFAESVSSLGAKAGVSSEEIEKAQSAFQSEFGGVLTSEVGADIARQAKEMGVGATELAKARRVFMTQTMGDTGAAKEAQDKFIGEFAKKGLTAKDAMAAIGQNSELLARNGTRFATSFARAAADAKKIGVDLSKIDQVGDSIIGDFEGFLEKQAELGAMGFGFDTSRLAEISETGDTGALMNELRTQLASTGKDITKLRRSEQLALSQAFGLSMEDMQRMAAGTEGSGEATLSPEELQKDANSKLGRLVNLAEVAGVVLATIASTLAFIAKNSTSSLGKSIAEKFVSTGRPATTGTTGAGTATTGTTGSPRTPSATVSAVGAMGKMTTGAKIGGGAGLLTGALSGIAEYQESGNIKKALARGLANLAGSVIGGALGSLIPIPGVGTMLGVTAGTWATNWLVDKVFADDMVSRPGYGQRTLVTPTKTIALNNNDNVMAYADDMVSGAANDGVRMLSYGALSKQASNTTPSVSVDLTRLEAKLDAMVRAIGSMKVEMDGTKVGKVMVATGDAAMTAGVFRVQSKT